MKEFLKGLLYENGAASRTGLAALFLIMLPMLALLILTFYMAIESKSFGQYESFIGVVEWLITLGVGLIGYNKKITTVAKQSSPNDPIDKVNSVKEVSADGK